MGAIDLEAAQKKLEEKRALLKQTAPKPIGLETKPLDKIKLPCKKCEQLFDVALDSWVANNPDKFICIPCDDEERENTKREIEERLHEQQMQRRLSNCGIGDRFRGMTFDSYKPENKDAQNVLNQCIKFVEEFNPESGTNLLLIGSPGTGKNMLAAIIGQEVIKKGYSFGHTTALRCVRRVKDSWRDKDATEQEIIDNYVGPALLVIDEVGVQFGSPTELLYLTEIINDRYEKRRPTILISNLTVKQLEEIVGARIMDRFYEGESKFLVFNWPSYRRK